MDKIKQLQQLKEMLDAQLISQEEYEKLKAELLNVNLNKIEVENQVNSTVNQVEQEKIEVTETKKETPKSVEESSTKEIEKEDFYTKEKSQYSKKGLFWFFLVVSAIVVFYQLHDRNVFKLRDKISEGYSDKVKIDIKDKVALEDYIQGKWSWERYTGDPNGTWRYRFEIIGDKLRIWSCMNNVKDPFEMGEGYDEFVFSLGDATRDVDGYNARYLEFGVFDNEYSLTYFGLEPFWLVSDENWDKPVLRCSSGMPSWSRAEFSSSGRKLNRETTDSESHSEFYTSQSDLEEEGFESAYNTSTEFNSRDIAENEISSESKTIKSTAIGSQIWQTENLSVEKFRNGDEIPQAHSAAEWLSFVKENKPAWCYFSFDEKNSDFGKIYNWYATIDERGLAPIGWHIPTFKEWRTLNSYISTQAAPNNTVMGAVWTNYFGGKTKSLPNCGFDGKIVGGLYTKYDDSSADFEIGRTWWWSYDKNPSGTNLKGYGLRLSIETCYLFQDNYKSLEEGRTSFHDGCYIRCVRD